MVALVTLSICLVTLQTCLAKVDVTVSFVEFINSKHELADGRCCDIPQENKLVCLLKCDPVITVCLTTGGRCNVYKGVTEEYTDGERFSLKNNMGKIPNPLTLTLENWNKSLLLTFVIRDLSDVQDTLMDKIDFYYGRTAVKPHGHGVFTKHSVTGRSVTITFHTAVQCANGFYGDTCNVYCKPGHLKRGHYTCSSNGTVICETGWTGPQCSMFLDVCSYNKCLNNATCIPHNNSYKCRCLSSFTGTHCEKTLIHGGTSSNEVNTTSVTTFNQIATTVFLLQTPPSTAPIVSSSADNTSTAETDSCNNTRVLQLEIDSEGLASDVTEDTVMAFLKQRVLKESNDAVVSKKVETRSLVQVTIKSEEKLHREDIVHSMQAHFQNVMGKKVNITDVSCRGKGREYKKVRLCQNNQQEANASTGTIVGATVGLLLLLCVIAASIGITKQWGSRIFPRSQKVDKCEATSSEDQEKAVLGMLENTKQAIVSSPPSISVLTQPH